MRAPEMLERAIIFHSYNHTASFVLMKVSVTRPCKPDNNMQPKAMIYNVQRYSGKNTVFKMCDLLVSCIR